MPPRSHSTKSTVYTATQFLPPQSSSNFKYFISLSFICFVRWQVLVLNLKAQSYLYWVTLELETFVHNDSHSPSQYYTFEFIQWEEWETGWYGSMALRNTTVPSAVQNPRNGVQIQVPVAEHGDKRKGWHPWLADDQVRLWQRKEGTRVRLSWQELKSSTQGCHLPAGLTAPTVTLCTTPSLSAPQAKHSWHYNYL